MTGKEVPLFMSKKILVFGSFVTDLTARTDRLPREGETVKGNSFYSGPGGKGSNQAVAAHRAGADVLLVTKLGRDAFGQNAKSFYTAEGRTRSPWCWAPVITLTSTTWKRSIR